MIIVVLTSCIERFNKCQVNIFHKTESTELYRYALSKTYNSSLSLYFTIKQQQQQHDLNCHARTLGDIFDALR